MDTVLITGTTSGIGAAFSEKFAKEGNNLILVSRNEDKLQRQQAELQSRYQVSVECISCDLAEDGAAELIANKARELGLSVDFDGNFHLSSVQIFWGLNGGAEIDTLAGNIVPIEEQKHPDGTRPFGCNG